MLDPAAPGFENYFFNFGTALSKDYAEVVVAYFTDSGGLSLRKPVAHINILFNDYGRRPQPGCQIWNITTDNFFRNLTNIMTGKH